MPDDRQPQQHPQDEPDDSEPAAGALPAGTAQVGNKKVPRPDKVSDRSVPDDIDE